MSAALTLTGLTKSFGALRATDNVTLSVAVNDCHAIIGPNGAGKSTLIGQITGEITPDAGRIAFFDADITGWSVPKRALAGLGRSFQITQLCADFSALDNVALAVQARQGHSYRFLRAAASDASLRNPAMEVLSRVGLEARAQTRGGRPLPRRASPTRTGVRPGHAAAHAGPRRAHGGHGPAGERAHDRDPAGPARAGDDPAGGA